MEWSMVESEDQILRRAKNGDRNSLVELLLHHGPMIRSGLDINRKWRSVLEANDIMQVTYFEAFEQIVRFEGDAKAFPRWLRRIADNNLRDAIQGLEREKRPQPDARVRPPDNGDDIVWLQELISGSVATPSRHAAGNEARQLLEAEIDKLPEDYGKVLRLVFFDGKPVGEVADEMGKTRGAVHLLRIRAINRLRERLGSGSQFFSFHA